VGGHGFAEGIDGLALAGVGGTADGLAAKGFDLGRGLVYFFFAPAGGNDVRTVAGESDGQGAADTGSAADDNGDAVYNAEFIWRHMQ
jgi:hypothetical protein